MVAASKKSVDEPYDPWDVEELISPTRSSKKSSPKLKWGCKEHNDSILSRHSCEFANVYDRDAVDAYGAWFATAQCRDGYPVTTAAGTFPANDFGLRDMLGSAREWTADCWNATHDGHTGRAAARQDGDCNSRVLKGGHFASAITEARPAFRIHGIAAHPNAYTGFRVARDLE